MAVRTHARARALAAAPASGMRIAAEAADLVAADAVGGRPLLVTGSARENVAARFSPVEAARVRIGGDPAGRMRIPRPAAIRADAARDVAGIACLGGVAAQAARGL